MNRLRLKDDDEDEEQLYERQALIRDNDDDICDSQISPSNGPINRRHKLKHSSDSDNNGFELRKVYRTRDFINDPNIEFTLYDIKSDDSLQSICLRYACPVNQVKRLNGLMNDQEFYGLRRLKLPLGKLGLLEDVLNRQNNDLSPDLIQINNNNDSQDNNEVVGSERKFVNSPGSALSVGNGNQRYSPIFKPLLSLGYSSDNLVQQNGDTYDATSNHISGNRQDNESHCPLQHNSRSFSSLREFNNDKNVRIVAESSNLSPQHINISSRLDTKELRQKSFIKSDIEDAHITVDTLLTCSEPLVPNVFEDLDYHVEKAKEAAVNYDQRAAELADRIAINDAGQDVLSASSAARVSKIPELFFSGENFGMNLTKLIALIFFICLVVPFVYMNQINVIK